MSKIEDQTQEETFRAYIRQMSSSATPLALLDANQLNCSSSKADSPIAKARSIVDAFLRDKEPRNEIELSLAFQCLYLSDKESKSRLPFIKKHLHLVLHYNTKKQISSALRELSTIFLVLTSAKRLTNVDWETMLNGVQASSTFPISVVLSFHFFVIQSVLQLISTNILTFLKREILPETSVIWKVAKAFAKGSNIDSCICACDLAAAQKHYKNAIKMLSGFIKVAEFMYSKSPSHPLHFAITALKIKKLRYQLDSDCGEDFSICTCSECRSHPNLLVFVKELNDLAQSKSHHKISSILQKYSLLKPVDSEIGSSDIPCELLVALNHADTNYLDSDAITKCSSEKLTNLLMNYLDKAQVDSSTCNTVSLISKYCASQKSVDTKIINSILKYLRDASTCGDIFFQCLSQIIPDFATVVIKSEVTSAIKSLSSICSQQIFKHDLSELYYAVSKLNLAYLRLIPNSQEKEKILNYVGQCIYAMFDQSAEKQAIDIAILFVEIEPNPKCNKRVSSIVSEVIYRDFDSMKYIFGAPSKLSPSQKLELFESSLSFLKSKLPVKQYHVVSQIISQLPDALSLACKYKTAYLFFLEITIDDSQVHSELDCLYTAALIVESGRIQTITVKKLKSIEEYFSIWVKSNNIQVKDVSVFYNSVVALSRMGFHNFSVKLINDFKSNKKIDGRLAFELELLLASCTLETQSFSQLPSVLKKTGKLLTQCQVTLEDIIRLKLLQLKYFILMGDKVKSTEKFNEIATHIKSKPEYNLRCKSDLSIEAKLNIFMILAETSFMASKICQLYADLVAALHYLKHSIKLLTSITRKLDTCLGQDQIKEATLITLLDTYSSGFIIAKSMGLPKEAIHFAIEFSKINELLRIPTLQVLNCFVSAIHLASANKRQLAVADFEAGVSGHANGEFYFLKAVELIASIYLKLDDYDLSSLKKNMSQVINNYNEITTVNSTHDFQMSFISISRSLDEFKYGISSNFHCTEIANDFDGTSQYFDSLTGTILNTKCKLMDVFEEMDLELTNFHLQPTVLPGFKKDQSLINHKNEPYITNIIQCKDLLMKLSSDDHLSYLDIDKIDDVHALLCKCVFLLSFYLVVKGEGTENLLKTIYFLKDKALALPLMNQKHIIAVNQSDMDLPDLPHPAEMFSQTCQESEAHLYNEVSCLLPQKWVVITIDICKLSGDFILSRLDAKSMSPVMLKLPFARTGYQQNFDYHLRILHEILAQSNRSTKFSTTSKIQTKEDRKTWWRLRFQLDSRLKNTLKEIEAQSFGGFKGILGSADRSSKSYVEFKADLITIWKKVVIQQNSPFELHASLIDLYYFLNPFHEDGFYDLDSVTDLVTYTANQLQQVDLMKKTNLEDKKWILEKLELLYKRTKPKDETEHVILIPSHKCSSVPWESMYTFRHRSVSRMPSTSFLIDSLNANKSSMIVPNDKPNRVLYVLNPGKDLQKTQSRFEQVLPHLPHSSGLSGEKPSEDWLVSSLFKSNLFVYLGHGGGEQYVRATSLFKAYANGEKKTNLPVALLMGCSSSAYQDNGLLQPSSNIFNWLACGAPAIVTNLWDITDKDIDILSLSLFAEWGLTTKICGETRNLAQALSMSRNACTLRYLNGAAPILHGLPLKLQ